MEICAVGGYEEVGKNCTAVKVGSEVVILDLGIHLEPYIKYTEDEEEDITNISAKELTRVGAIPNISVIKDWADKVKAIIPSHAHLDHVGAIPYLSDSYRAPIICTPFTKEVIRTILKDEKIRIKNKVKSLNINSKIRISKDITVEFINVTHSTPQTVMVALHTKEGTILYANDFKFDLYPTLGQKPNFERLKQLGKEGVKLLIVDSTYAGLAQKMPSEAVAKQMLTDVMLGVDSTGKAVIVTTFSSHLARLKSIIELGKRLNRKIVFMGRSLAKYVKAGENVRIVNFSKEAEVLKYKRQIKHKLKQITKEGKEKYLLVVTGHQGEPESTLSRLVAGEFDFKFDSEDHVIFSCKTIPSPTNIENRERLEKQLKQFGVRIFKDIHASGHAAREDLRDLINFVKPEHIMPAHGEQKMTSELAELAEEMGYKTGKNIHLMTDGKKVVID